LSPGTGGKKIITGKLGGKNAPHLGMENNQDKNLNKPE